MVTRVTTARAANLYLRNVWKLHGLLPKVVSNRGLQFVTAFMKEMYQLLGIEAMTSTPEVFTVPPHSRRIPGGMDANSMWIPSIPYGICLAEGPAI